MLDTFDITPEMLARRPEMARDGYKVGDKVRGSVLIAKYSHYMQQFDSKLTDQIAEHRHHQHGEEACGDRIGK